MSKKMKSNILLLLTAFIWGSAFVAQKSGMDYIEPFTYNGIRTFIGGLVLIPVIIFFAKKNNKQSGKNEKRRPRSAGRSLQYSACWGSSWRECFCMCGTI